MKMYGGVGRNNPEAGRNVKVQPSSRLTRKPSYLSDYVWGENYVESYAILFFCWVIGVDTQSNYVLLFLSIAGCQWLALDHLFKYYYTGRLKLRSSSRELHSKQLRDVRLKIERFRPKAKKTYKRIKQKYKYYIKIRAQLDKNLQEGCTNNKKGVERKTKSKGESPLKKPYK